MPRPKQIDAPGPAEMWGPLDKPDHIVVEEDNRHPIDTLAQEFEGDRERLHKEIAAHDLDVLSDRERQDMGLPKRKKISKK
ncbi:MAG: hypothetical protein NUV56_03265 [Candidatus Uhrbacteria bacterium]|nr:hypothetical protein [Candidatus Uhrbacteria bacterium]